MSRIPPWRPLVHPGPATATQPRTSPIEESFSSTISIRLIPEILLLVEQIRSRTSQVDDFRTPIPILFESGALKTVERIAYALSATDDTFVLVVAKRALVADTDERGGADVGVADGTLAVAFVAEAADGDARRFAAHY